MKEVTKKEILSKGYGVCPKLVMTDKRLTVEAKAIYMYISSFCGNRNEAYPKVSTMLSHLNISKNRFYTHIKFLEELGYIQVKKRRKKNENNKWVSDSNIYVLNDIVDISREIVKKDSKSKSKKQKIKAEDLENLENEDPQKIEDRVELEDSINSDPHNDTKEDENYNGVDSSYKYKLQMLREYGYSVNDEQQKLLKKMDENILKEAIKISLAQGGKSFNYVYKVYSNKNYFNKHQKNSDNSMKKTIHMCDTTIIVDGALVNVSELPGDRLDEIIEARARNGILRG